MFNYYENFNSHDVVTTYKEIITINITKREVDCELNNFKSNLVYGESNLFKAKFYSGNTSFCLENETLQCLIRNNGEIIYQTNFTTDNDGMLLFNLSTVKHLGLGRNDISFIIKNSVHYLDTTFSYEVHVKKIPVYVEYNSFYFVNICLLSILTSLFTSIGLKVYKYKKSGFKLIRDITFKF